jgi:predicted outer membrane repeat protein
MIKGHSIVGNTAGCLFGIVREMTYPATARRAVLTTAFTTLLTVAAVSTAQAASYQVLTSTNPQDLLNPNDGYCNIAEAVKSITDNASYPGCTDLDTSNPGSITLTQAANKPYASFPYLLRNGTIAITKSLRIQPSEEGFTAQIQSTGALAFRVYSPAEVTLYGLNINHTGTGSGRLIWNEGTLNIANTTVQNGNVTTEPAGKGGGIYNKGNLWMSTCQITTNHAKRGGGIYNEGGSITIYDSTISQNEATMAGGGIYNLNATAGGNPPTDITAYSTTVTGNKAKAGGGIFTRGVLDFFDSTLKSNQAVTGGGSGETCGAGASCDGFGGGVCSVAASNITYSRIAFHGNSLIDSNTADTRGGAFYSAGQLELITATISNNSSRRGGAIFASNSGTNHYCNVSAPEGQFSFVNANKLLAGGKYSILDWDPNTALCGFGSNPPRVKAQGNTLTTEPNGTKTACASGSANPSCPE